MSLSNEEIELLLSAAVKRRHPDPSGFVARTALINSDENFGHKKGVGITGIRAGELRRLGLSRAKNMLENIDAAISSDLQAFDRFDNSLDKMHIAFLRGDSMATRMPKDALDLIERIDKKVEKSDLLETNLHTETTDVRSAIDKGTSVPDKSLGQSVEEIIVQHLERGNVFNIGATGAPFINTVLSEIDQIG